VAKRLQIKQKATETKSHIFVRNHKTEFLEHTYILCFIFYLLLIRVIIRYYYYLDLGFPSHPLAFINPFFPKFGGKDTEFKKNLSPKPVKNS
jgi:hypothetical protein